MITLKYKKCNPWSRRNMTNVIHDYARMKSSECLGWIFDLDIKKNFYSLSLLMTLILNLSLNFCFALFWERVFLYFFGGGGGVVFWRRLTRIKNQKVYKFCCRKSIFFLDTNVLLIHVYSDLLVFGWMCFLPLILFQYDIKP